MLTKIAKVFKWEMSHRLPYHDLYCKNIHGHTYRLRIEVIGEPDKYGMVIDYYELAKIFQPILEQLDHCFLCDVSDEIMLDFLKQNNFKHLVIPFYSTAENIAFYIMNLVKPKFERFDNIKQIGIRIFETDDVFAEVQWNL